MASPIGGGLTSAFSPYSDSPNSPARFSTFQSGPHSNRCVRLALGSERYFLMQLRY